MTEDRRVWMLPTVLEWYIFVKYMGEVKGTGKYRNAVR